MESVSVMSALKTRKLALDDKNRHWPIRFTHGRCSDTQRGENHPITPGTRFGNAAFTVIELMLALAVLAALIAIAVPTYSAYIDRAKLKVSIADIKKIELMIKMFNTGNFNLPDSLADVPSFETTDPWGNTYRYLRIEGSGLKGKGKLKKDKSLNPLNTDYDLYSVGPDGLTHLQSAVQRARDDIIRANNGNFVGIADDY